jgi:hypothetical protein
MSKKVELRTLAKWLERWGINPKSNLEGVPMELNYLLNMSSPINEGEAVFRMLRIAFHMGANWQRIRTMETMKQIFGL